MRKLFVTVMALAMVMVMAPAASASHNRGTITDIVVASGGEFDDRGRDFDILLNAVVAADLAGALADADASYTVFAPNDAAFIRTARDLGFTGTDEAGAWAFLVEAFTALGGGDPIPLLTEVLLYHVAPEKLNVFQVLFGGPIDTLQGEQIRPRFLSLRDKEPDLRNPRLVLRDLNIRADNGIIHTINRVLIPVDLP